AYMKLKLVLFLGFFIFLTATLSAQTKVGGTVLDDTNSPLPYANVYFKGSAQGVVADENGKFYLESPDTFTQVVVSFVGYEPKEVQLTKQVTYDLKVVLSGSTQLKEVVVYSGKTSK